MQLEDGQTSRLRALWRDAAAPILVRGSVVLSFGWNTVGMGIKYGFRQEEILLVCHGADHNDTICVAERKLDSGQGEFHLSPVGGEYLAAPCSPK